jgi:hypothetical protein
VSSYLLAGRSAVLWEDSDFETVFCGEQLPFVLSVSVPMGELGFSDSVFGEHLSFGQSVSGPVGRLGYSDCVL